MRLGLISKSRDMPLAKLSKHLMTTLGILLCSALLIAVFWDQHRSVTKRMGWQCVAIADTGNRKFPHMESIKMWFLENPRYEEHASGPHLCADLKATGRTDAAVAFDVWGTRVGGLHGYNMISIAVGSKQLRIYESESGGFHSDRFYGPSDTYEDDRRRHPELYRLPLDVFE